MTSFFLEETVTKDYDTIHAFSFIRIRQGYKRRMSILFKYENNGKTKSKLIESKAHDQ